MQLLIASAGANPRVFLAASQLALLVITFVTDATPTPEWKKNGAIGSSRSFSTVPTSISGLACVNQCRLGIRPSGTRVINGFGFADSLNSNRRVNADPKFLGKKSRSKNRGDKI